MTEKLQKDYLEKVYQYASEYLNLYKASETIEREVDIGFDDKSRSLGFRMEVGNLFIERYSEEAFYHIEDFKKVVDSVNDIVLLGTAILSRWRYVTHWTQSSLLEKENREWFILAFERLVEISANVESRNEDLTMSTREERIQVFQDTLNWIKSDPALSASVDVAKKKTTIYYEDEYPAFDASKSRSNSITISGDRSFQAAMRLRREYPDAKIAVMNFANAFHAGGGVTKGSSAQEESLCRTSTLYPLIYRRSLRDSFYKHHKKLNTPKASDSLIYTEGVIICKTDDDLPERMPQENWVSVDVITIAAPDLRTKSNQHAPLVGGGASMNKAELFGYHVKRAIHMLTCAAAQKADILVLGAFGCGAFENDPNVVARAYRTALEEFPKVFERIEFAIYCPSGKSENYDAFEQELNLEVKS